MFLDPFQGNSWTTQNMTDDKAENYGTVLAQCTGLPGFEPTFFNANYNYSNWETFFFFTERANF